MRTPRTLLLALLVTFGLVAAACGDDDDSGAVNTGDNAAAEVAEESSSDEMGDIVTTAVGAGEFPTLIAAVEAAGLVETLHGEGPFTVFAPTEEAFAAALDGLGITAEELLADTETLTSILTYHVIADEVPAEVVVTLDGQDVETVNGATVAITVADDTVMVNDATVVEVDIFASNGVIHVIDTVLLPPAS